MWRVLPTGPVRVKFACKFIQIKCDPMRFMSGGRRSDQARIERNFAHESEFRRILEALECSFGKPLRAGPGSLRQIPKHFPCVAENRFAASMAVLDVEHRIV